MEHADAGQPFDLVIIGGGSAASAAVTEAVRLGKRVAKIQDGPIAGTCLNVGCLPSTTLLAAAKDYARARESGWSGAPTSAGPIDLGELVAHKERFLDAFRAIHRENAASGAFTHLDGVGRFVGERDGLVQVAVSGRDGIVEARSVLIATGAEPFIPPIPGLAEADHLTSETSMSLQTLPSSLVIIGGNAIGLEQAQLFTALGTQVTVVEAASRIAPSEDPALSDALRDALRAQGVTIVTGADITEVEAGRGGAGGFVVAAALGDGSVRLEAEKILVATGRRPSAGRMNLAALGIATGARGEVLTDETLRTTHPQVWAAGDVTGQAQFVYVATAQGTAAAANALGGERRTLDYTTLPRVVFTSPPVASVGLTADQAGAAGVAVEVREVPMSHVSRALVDRATSGLIRLVSDRTNGRVLGVHMVGADAGEVIAVAGAVIALGGTVAQLATNWMPYLTMSEALQLVAAAAPLPVERS